MKVFTTSGVYEIKEHRVKIFPSYFEAQVNNSKNFEIRKNDRNYQVGDLLLARRVWSNNRKLHRAWGSLLDHLYDDF